MFNKTTFTFLLFLWVLNQSFAQQEPLSRCGTIEKTDAEMEALPWYGNGAYLDQIRISRSSMLTGNTSVQDRDVSECPDIDAPFLLPIRFWIYRETDTETGLPNARELQV